MQWLEVLLAFFHIHEPYQKRKQFSLISFLEAYLHFLLRPSFSLLLIQIKGIISPLFTWIKYFYSPLTSLLIFMQLGFKFCLFGLRNDFHFGLLLPLSSQFFKAPTHHHFHRPGFLNLRTIDILSCMILYRIRRSCLVYCMMFSSITGLYQLYSRRPLPPLPLSSTENKEWL